jgi:hypothetical protein
VKRLFIIISLFTFYSCSQNDEEGVSSNQIVLTLEESWERLRAFDNSGPSDGYCRLNKLNYTDSNTLGYSVRNHFSLDTLRVEFIPNNMIYSDNNIVLGFNPDNNMTQTGTPFDYMRQLFHPEKVKYIDVINYTPDKLIAIKTDMNASLNWFRNPIIFYESNVNWIEILEKSMVRAYSLQCKETDIDEVNKIFKKEVYNDNDFKTQRIFFKGNKVNHSVNYDGVSNAINVEEVKIGEYIYIDNERYKVIKSSDKLDEVNKNNQATSNNTNENNQGSSGTTGINNQLNSGSNDTNTQDTSNNTTENQTTSTSDSSKRTSIPDTYFEQGLIDLGYDNILDGYVLTENIVNVERLSLPHYGIVSLEGIEAFKNLTELRIDNSPPSVVAFANTNDKALNERMKNGTKNNLKSVNLNSNLKLQHLYIPYNNELNQINISNLQALIGLSINGCSALKSIDLSNNQNLNWINAGFMNSLSNIDLSNQPELGYLSLRASNSLTAINLSTNNKLIKFDATSSSIECIQVSKYQMENQVINGSIEGVVSPFIVNYMEGNGQVFSVNWEITSQATYTLDCSN